MSYARTFQDILKEKNSVLHARLIELKQLANIVLTYTAGGFPYYTPHGFTHSEQVEENLNWLVPDEMKPEFSDWEIFFMIIAAWMHDWGMVCKPGESPDQIRKIHHIRTEQNFESLYNNIKLDEGEALIIGRIARGHRVEDLHSELFKEQIFKSNNHIDVRFLTALVRLADECDITYNRVPELIYYSLSPEGTSEEHFLQHLKIKGIGKSGDHKIEFYGIAYDPKASITLRKLQDKLQKELDHVKDILFVKNIKYEFIEAHIDARGFIDKPIGFKLDERKITELLIGNSIYERDDVAIRELIQNSVDACNLKLKIESTSTPKIRLYKKDNTLVIEDDGIGMDYESASNFLSNKGFSFYTSDEFKKLNECMNYDPISRWGLGILSCFLMADSIEIETKSKNKDACKFLISKVEEGWRFERGTMVNSGTKITLFLKPKFTDIELEKILRHYVKNSSIPIYIDEKSETPICFDWNIDDDHIQTTLEKRMTMRNLLPIFDKYEEYENDDFAVRIYTEKFWYTSIFYSQQGFFVKNFIDIPAPSGISLIQAKKHILDLDIARDNINTETESYLEFHELWFKFILDMMEKKYSEQIKNSKTDIERFHHKCNGLENFGITMFLLRRLGEKEKNSPIPSLHKMFFSHDIFLIITKNEIKLTNMNNMSELKLEKIKFCPYLRSEKSQQLERLKFFCEYLKDSLQDDEIVIMTPISDDPLSLLRFKEMILENLKINDIELLWIQDIMREPLIKVNSFLDSLIPSNTEITKLPKPFKSAVFCPIPFKIKREDGNRPVSIEIGIVLLDLKETDDFTIIEKGKFVYDINDEFIQILLNYEKEIMGNEPVSTMIKDYFVLLVLKFIQPFGFPYDLILSERETEIKTLLKIKKDIPDLVNRLGNGSFLLTSFSSVNHIITEENGLDARGLHFMLGF